MKIFIFLLTLLITNTAFAEKCDLSKIVTKKEQIIKFPPSAKVYAGYLNILNYNKSPIILQKVNSEFSTQIEIHFMQVKNGIMRMKKLDSGLEITSNSFVRLRPGGLHIMFKKLNKKINYNSDQIVKLDFGDCGVLKTNFKVLKKFVD